jgi:AraC-like DNA-binding protein
MEPICFKVPKLKEETIRVEFWDLPYFYEPVHFHEECQITYIIEGRGVILVGARFENFREGDLFFIGKNQPHVLRHDDKYYIPLSKLHARAISIFFSLDTFLQILDQIDEAVHLKNLINQSRYGIRVSRKEALKIVQDINMIYQEKGIFRFLRFIRILEGLSKCQNLSQMTHSAPYIVGKTDSFKMNKVLNYIIENYDRRITLDEVAYLVNMTSNAFCKFFKTHTNKTFSSFLIEVRINQACKMLSEGNNNISETYDSCGYNNSSNFHRHFRRQTGLTPSEYLDKFRKQFGLALQESVVYS